MLHRYAQPQIRKGTPRVFSPLRRLAIGRVVALLAAAGALLPDVLRADEPSRALSLPLTNYEPRLAAAPADEWPAPAPATESTSQSDPGRDRPPPSNASDSYDVEYTVPDEPWVRNGAGDGCQSCQNGGMPGMRLPNGQYADNWLAECGGSPYRTGPGNCDNWKVGPMWDVSVEGITLHRDNANLGAMQAVADDTFPPGIDPGAPREFQFDYDGGARIFATGELSAWPTYQLQFGYEGIEAWNAALIYPEYVPPDGDDDMITARRTVQYDSSFHSAEFNFYRQPTRFLRPFMGFRYVRFSDEILDKTDESAPFPPPSMGGSTEVSVLDTRDFFDIKNNLIGFQVGLREDTWQVNRRFALQGFLNAGVYYNHIQFSEGSLSTTTTYLSDDLDSPELDESRTIRSTTGIVASSEPSDVAYMAEASISAICRLNRCVALRGGYQLLWIEGLRLAEDAYLGRELGQHGMVMQGWHVGIEYRR